MSVPIEDKQVLRALTLQYGHCLEALQVVWSELPIYKSDCRTERSIKRRLIDNRIKKYLDGDKTRV